MLLPDTRHWLNNNFHILKIINNPLPMQRQIKKLISSAKLHQKGYTLWEGFENIFGYRTENLEGEELQEYLEEVKFWISNKDHYLVSDIPITYPWDNKLCHWSVEGYRNPQLYMTAGSTGKNKAFESFKKTTVRTTKNLWFAQCT